MSRNHAAAFATILLVSALTVPLPGAALPQQSAERVQMPDGLRARAERDGRVRVIVELRLPSGGHVPEGRVTDPALIAAQRRAIADAGERVLSRLDRAGHRLLRRYATVPYLALETNASALDALAAAPRDVARVYEDSILRMDLAQSVPLVEADQAWASGYDGDGTAIAVLDTGVDALHPFLGGRVVEEACYSSTVAGTSRSVCPNGLDEQVGAGAAAPCPQSGCNHGTHVAGIAAGDGPPAGQPFSGVAKRARLMAVQVFSEIIDPASCGFIAPCLGAFSSDVIAGLERVYAVAAQRQIVAVNMSLGGGAFTAVCDDQPYKPVIDNLRAIGVATIAASGNSGYTSRMTAPGCVSSAVSVGSTDKTDTVSWFSNVTSFLSLFAPGGSIVSSVPGVGFDTFSGTSMATPHVAGAWALLRQAVPSASVSTLLDVLQQTGTPIADTRFGGTATVPRIRILRALSTFVPITSPAPQATSVSPDRVRAGNGTAMLTITGSGFNTFSVMHWNGAARPTTVLSTTQLRGTITDTDLTSPGTALVTVVTPAPGGGTSAPLTVVVDPPPSLTVNPTTVAPGSPSTVTLANGYGGSSDWLALAAVGAANSSYLKWTYVGAGVTERTWTVTMPGTPGQYEFRLFRNNGYTRGATSPPVTVDSTVNPLPIVSSLSPSRTAVGGAAFTLTVNGSSFRSSSVVTWNGANRSTTFVSASQLKASIGAADIAALGTVQVAVATPAPGGGTSAALTFTIAPPPSISVSATTATGGTNVTATLTNGFGGASDWLALAATTAPNTSYLKYTIVGTGATERTWTVAMPSTAGTYEFRLFINGYTRVATSQPITVVPGPNPVPVLTSITPSSTMVGAGAFTLVVKGSAFVSASVVRWNGANRSTTFVSATELRAAIPAADVATAGTAQVTVFSPEPGGGLSSALPFTAGVSNASLSVSATTAAPGASVTVTLTNGFGGSTDWLALAATSAPNSSYLRWTYVGSGVTNRTWTVTMPATPGTYEFRLFLNNGSTRAATSPAVTVVSQ